MIPEANAIRQVDLRLLGKQNILAKSLILSLQGLHRLCLYITTDRKFSTKVQKLWLSILALEIQKLDDENTLADLMCKLENAKILLMDMTNGVFKVRERLAVIAKIHDDNFSMFTEFVKVTISFVRTKETNEKLAMFGSREDEHCNYLKFCIIPNSQPNLVTKPNPFICIYIYH